MNIRSEFNPFNWKRLDWRSMAVKGLLSLVLLLIFVPSKTFAEGQINIGDGNEEPNEEEPVPESEETMAELTLLNADGGQIAFTQTGNIFCRVLYLQETAGVTVSSVKITVTQLSGSSGVPVQPEISEDGCDGTTENPTEKTLMDLDIHSITQIYYRVKLNEVATYSGLILIQIDGQAAVPYTIQIERTGQTLMEGLAISTPAPVEGITNGRKVTLPFTVDSTNGEVIDLTAPELRALNKMDGDTVVREVSGQAAISLMPTSTATLTAGAGLTVMLGVEGLPAGKYQAEIAVPTQDGRRISATATFYMRHPWLFPILFLFAAVFLVEIVRYLNTTGKSKDEKRYSLSFIWSNTGRLKFDANQIEGIQDREGFVKIFDEFERWFGVAFQEADQDFGPEMLGNLVQDSSTRLEQAKNYIDNVEALGINLQIATEQADTDAHRTSVSELHQRFRENWQAFGRLLCSNELSKKPDGAFDKNKIVTDLEKTQKALTELVIEARKLPYTWRLEKLEESAKRLSESDAQKSFLTSLKKIEETINNSAWAEAEGKLEEAFKVFLSLYQADLSKKVESLGDSQKKTDLGEKLSKAETAIGKNKLQDAENILKDVYEELKNVDVSTSRPKTLNVTDVLSLMDGLGSLPTWEAFPILTSRRRNTWEAWVKERLDRVKIQRRRTFSQLLSALLTVIIAVVAAFLTQVINQPDFGGVEDYIVLFLFVLGGSALTTSTLTDVRFSNLKSYLGES